MSKETKQTYAGKVVEKASLQKLRHKRRMESEIQIHKQLNHENIVKFEHFFEDEDNVYIMLELCENKSMSELMRKRGSLSEFEARYYCK